MSLNKVSKIKLFVLDVDGVMTDGRIVYQDSGKEWKSFDVKDGLGLKLLMSRGIEVAIISGRESGAVKKRARELGIHTIYQGISDKRPVMAKLKQDKRLAAEEIACMGDDLPDLQIFQEVGLRITVADGVDEVRKAADYITKCRGGRGAVREACEWLLKQRGDWADILSFYRGK